MQTRSLIRLRQPLLATCGIYLLATFGIHFAEAYSNGQVFPACNTMYPVHISVGPQWSVSPYSVFATQNPDGTVDVTLQSEVAGEMFKGFLLQARNATNMRVGTFVAVPPTAQVLQCGFNGGAVSHNSVEGKTKVTVLWMPGVHNGDVTFRATVVRNYMTFWTQVLSPTYAL